MSTYTRSELENSGQCHQKSIRALPLSSMLRVEPGLILIIGVAFSFHGIHLMMNSRNIQPAKILHCTVLYSHKICFITTCTVSVVHYLFPSLLPPLLSRVSLPFIPLTLSLSLSLSTSLCLYLSFFVSLSLSLFVSLPLSVFLSLSTSLCLSTPLFIVLFIYDIMLFNY